LTDYLRTYYFKQFQFNFERVYQRLLSIPKLKLNLNIIILLLIIKACLMNFL
jgi:hypothetical protein